MEIINSDKAPQAIGPYSQAVKTGNLVYCSGQLGVDRETGKLVEGGIEEQTHQLFKNIRYVLAEEGLDLSNVVKSLVFLTDMDNFAKVNEIYGSYFEEPYPARSAIEVKGLPRNGLVEIEVIAEIKN